MNHPKSEIRNPKSDKADALSKQLYALRNALLERG